MTGIPEDNGTTPHNPAPSSPQAGNRRPPGQGLVQRHSTKTTAETEARSRSSRSGTVTILPVRLRESHVPKPSGRSPLSLLQQPLTAPRARQKGEIVSEPPRNTSADFPERKRERGGAASDSTVTFEKGVWNRLHGASPSLSARGEVASRPQGCHPRSGSSHLPTPPREQSQEH